MVDRVRPRPPITTTTLASTALTSAVSSAIPPAALAAALATAPVTAPVTTTSITAPITASIATPFAALRATRARDLDTLRLEPLASDPRYGGGLKGDSQ